MSRKFCRTRTEGRRALRMELNPVEVVPLYAGAEGCAVNRGGRRRRAHRQGIAVHEVRVAARAQSGEQRGLALHDQGVPPDVGHRAARRVGEADGAPGNDPEAGRLSLLGSLEQELHAETDAEHGLAQPAQRLVQTEAFQTRHGVGGRAHPRQNHMRGAADGCGVAGDARRHVQALQRELQGGDVGAAARHDGDVAARAHSDPLVLGRSLPSRRTACRRLRPTPLKHASIM